jgi:hypothetical protein
MPGPISPYDEMLDSAAAPRRHCHQYCRWLREQAAEQLARKRSAADALFQPQPASKAALLSMDSTIRSNLSVGLPLDLVLVKRDRCEVARHLNIDHDNAYFASIRKR